MPRILHVLSSPRGIGGAERILAELISECGQHHWQQRVVNLFGPNKELNSLLRTEAVVDIKGTSLLSLKRMRATLISEFKNFRPDVAHAHLFHASVMCSALPQRFRTNLILTHHHGDFYEAQGRTLRSALDRWAARRFRHVVAVSRYSERFLAERYALDPHVLKLIRNGCRKLDAKRPLVGRPTVVCVGGFRLEKGHEILLKATSLLRADFPDLRVLLVGDGPARHHIEETIRRLDIEHSVQFVGSVEAVESYLTQGRVAVVPSLIEQFGLGVLEAMSAGIPVVASAVGGIPELISHRENGMLVAPRDPVALADAIRDLLDSPELSRKLRRNGRATAASLPIDKTTQAYHDLYRQVATPSSGVSPEDERIVDSGLDRSS